MTVTAVDSTHGVTRRQAIYADDLDGYGMLHHTKYALLFDHAVTDFWREAGWSLDASESVLVIRDLSLRYLLPITSTGTVAVHFWVERVSVSKATYRFEILSDDLATKHAEGTRTIVNLDPHTLRSAPMSAQMWATARPLLGPDVTPPPGVTW